MSDDRQQKRTSWLSERSSAEVAVAARRIPIAQSRHRPGFKRIAAKIWSYSLAPYPPQRHRKCEQGAGEQRDGHEGGAECSPISLRLTASRAGASAAMAFGPRSIMLPNSFAVSGSLAAITDNKTAATSSLTRIRKTRRDEFHLFHADQKLPLGGSVSRKFGQKLTSGICVSSQNASISAL
jgi:hypothetical protein